MVLYPLSAFRAQSKAAESVYKAPECTCCIVTEGINIIQHAIGSSQTHGVDTHRVQPVVHRSCALLCGLHTVSIAWPTTQRTTYNDAIKILYHTEWIYPALLSIC